MSVEKQVVSACFDWKGGIVAGLGICLSLKLEEVYTIIHQKSLYEDVLD